jgi:outer membrane protein TolC
MKRNILCTTLALALFAFGAADVKAQDSLRLTLKDAILKSIANSKQLKGNMARIDEATAVLKQAKDNQLPDLSVSGSYLYLPITPNIDLKTGGSGGSGGGSSAPAIEAHQAMYAMVSGSLPIYAGGKIKYGIESAKYLLEATRLDNDNDKEAIAQNAIFAFTNLYKAKASVDIIRENLAQSRDRDSDFAHMEANGLMARNDVLKAALQTSNIELALMDAERNFTTTTLNMNLMLGLPEKTALSPDEAGLYSVGELKTADEYEQLSLQHRKDVDALAHRLKAANTGIKTAKADLYPSIGLSAGYIAADIPNVLVLTNAIDIGVGVKYSVSSLWKTKAKVQQAQAKVKEVEANQEALYDQVRLQVNDAYQVYLVSVKKIDVYNKAVEQANENYKITKNKYDNSLVTTTDLLDANVAELQARLNKAFAQADAMVSYSKLLQVSGLLPVTDPSSK